MAVRRRWKGATRSVQPEPEDRPLPLPLISKTSAPCVASLLFPAPLGAPTPWMVDMPCGLAEGDGAPETGGGGPGSFTALSPGQTGHSWPGNQGARIPGLFLHSHRERSEP